MKIKLLFLTLLSLFISNCEPVYKAANFREIANSHKTIAVLPPKVIIEIKSKTDKEKILTQEKLESLRFQQALVEYLNLHYGKNDIFVAAQNEEITNKMLLDNGITSLTNQNYKDLAVLLNVDAVVSSRISLAKPLTNAASFFTGLLTGYMSPSKVTTVDLSLTDRNSGKMFWNFNFENGGTFTSTEKLTNSLMKAAAYRFPYKTKDLNKTN
ncbi:hypothetical protein SAMN05421847_2959 [Halpernia humi]|uniref:Lipoprotein n=1 Tax=Halpernia humi TaxID=493375 RepID=A0A1H6BKG6_9FLAO|nr:hypothetical protein [Halpernia humi]SEG61208.1 hypothetical protein SAMN05421847_2959 [Halpernia humi]